MVLECTLSLAHQADSGVMVQCWAVVPCLHWGQASLYPQIKQPRP